MKNGYKGQGLAGIQVCRLLTWGSRKPNMTSYCVWDLANQVLTNHKNNLSLHLCWKIKEKARSAQPLSWLLAFVECERSLSLASPPPALSFFTVHSTHANNTCFYCFLIHLITLLVIKHVLMLLNLFNTDSSTLIKYFTTKLACWSAQRHNSLR